MFSRTTTVCAVIFDDLKQNFVRDCVTKLHQDVRYKTRNDAPDPEANILIVFCTKDV